MAAGGYAEAAGIGSSTPKEISDLGVMSKRTDRTNAPGVREDLADAGVETILGREQSNGLLTPALASQEALDNARRDMRRNADRQEMAAAASVENVENRSDVIEQKTSGKPADTTTSVSERKSQSLFNRPWGWTGKSREARTSQPSIDRVPSSLRKKIKNRMKNAFGNSGEGYRVYGKMLGLPTIGFRDVAIGIDEMVAAVQRDPTMVNRLFRPHFDSTVSIDDVSAWSTSDIIQFVRTHEIYVGTFKPPNNRGQDVQRRRLRILETERRGIYIHPVMAAMYTADFDGDDMEVSFDPDVAEYASDPMDLLIGIDGKLSLDMAFLPIVEFRDDNNPDGKSAREYVREVVFAEFSQIEYSPDGEVIDGRNMRALIDAYLDLGKTEKMEGKYQEAAYGRVFREARRLADNLNPGDKAASDDLMGRLSKAIYDGMHNLKVYNVLRVAGAGVEVTAQTTDDFGIYKIVDGMVDGDVPNNFQALKVMLNGYLGSVEGKNAPFRFSADVGKMLKMDSRLQVGEDLDYIVDPNNDEDMKSLFESTVKFASSKVMAKEIKKQGIQEYYSQKLREKVISEIGFPDAKRQDGSPRYATYAEFVNAFVRTYNRHASVINQANLIFNSEMAISNDDSGHVSPIKFSGRDARGNKTVLMVTDVAEPLMTVYGSYGVGRMFSTLMSEAATEEIDPLWAGNPNTPRGLRYSQKHEEEREYNFGSDGFWITRKYSEYSLRAFSHENRLPRGKDSDEMQKLADMRVSDLGNDDVFDQFYVLLAIADKRTGTESTFNQRFYGLIDENAKAAEARRKSGDLTGMEMMSKLLLELRKLDKDDSRTQMIWANEIIGVLAESGADMFSHFGMDSPAGFLESEWAKKMMEHAGDVEVLGGIRTAMVYEYRMAHVNKLISEMPDPLDVSGDAYAYAVNNLQLAKDELGDASEVWHGILRELAEEDANGTEVVHTDGTVEVRESAFKTLSRGVRPMQQVEETDRKYAWGVELNAKDFWEHPGSHDSLLSVINDLDMDRKTKWAVISDVVGYWEQDAYLKSYEVGFQLEVGNDSSYILGSSNRQASMKVYNDFKGAFTTWGNRNQENLTKDVRDARRKYGKKPGMLIRTLERINSSPWELIQIDDMMYADALMSIKDKTYAQTEKASQHPWTNAIYNALSMQRNGGLFNDVWRTDDRVLGVVSDKSVGIQDVIRILADPDAELTVYNVYGEYTVIDRNTLLEDTLGRPVNDADIEQDIWEYLEREPRIAAALRRHTACTRGDAKGKGYVGASLSISETIELSNHGGPNPIDHVKYLMRDHPVYAGIISLASPGRASKDGISGWVDSVSRNERRRVRQIEEWLCDQIYRAASSGDDSAESAARILRDMGITSTSLTNVLRPGYDQFCEQLGLPVGGANASEYREDAMTTYVTVSEHLTKYIDEVRDNVPPRQKVGGRHSNGVPKPTRMGVDMVSMASFWDMVQELSGAKTNESTSVEGFETYNFGIWASHLNVKDHYASLTDIENLDQSWNGAWTNVTDESGNPVMLMVDEDGRPANTFQVREGVGRHGRATVVNIFQWAKMQGLSEVVVLAPDGYQVSDGSTDTHGTPVPSLFSYMVSKRSNGAEAFNLKAKKAGLDGKDSITKMSTKYLAGSDGRPVSFVDMLNDLRSVAEAAGENGLAAARLSLAQRLLTENEELGYKDLTLANYMNIAELMVTEGEDGQIYLRSLEMLYSAIKYRIGTVIDELTDSDVSMIADEILADGSETGIGISEMLAREAFDAVRPNGKAGSTSGMRLSSSMFARNYDLLSQLAESEEALDAQPMSPSRASILDREFRGRDGISDVIARTSVVRNYNIVGYAGATSGISQDIKWTVGPQNMVVIGDGEVSSEDVARICDRAYELGMTVLISSAHAYDIPKDMIYDAMPCSNGSDVLIPCFDMRLNGSESKPYNGGRFAIHQMPYERYTTSVEDPLNFFQLGDAQAIATRAYADRVKVRDNGTISIKAEDLFPNVFRNREFRHCLFSVSTLTPSEVQLLIADEVDCTIDYGIVEGAPGFEQRKRDVDAAIERYQERFSEADPDGYMMGIECQPGDIVAWVQVEIENPMTDEYQYVIAPIIPFELHGPTKNLPETFKVEGFDPNANGDNTVMEVNWVNTTEIENSFAKYFDSSGGANKGMINFSRIIENVLQLRDKSNVDVYIARQSTDSRKIGTDRRIKTMISLMAKARMRGYNFARKPDGTPNEGSFPVDETHPENEGLRERMLTERIPRYEWDAWMDHGNRTMLFTNDQRMNAFLNYECRKILLDGGNPYDYLANTYTDKRGREQNTHVMWEFEAMFDQGLNYEDSLLRFLHSMMPDFCPNGVDDKDGTCLFRLARQDDSQDNGAEIATDFNRGVLQMQVPYPYRGQTRYLWANVYVGQSFFGEDYSGFSRPNVDGSSNFLDAMNTRAYYGNQLDDDSFQLLKAWATSDIGRPPRDGGAIGKA